MEASTIMFQVRGMTLAMTQTRHFGHQTAFGGRHSSGLRIRSVLLHSVTYRTVISLGVGPRLAVEHHIGTVDGC